MSDIVDALATQTGISPELAHKGLGALLSFLKEHLGEGIFGQIESSIPDASSAISKFESSPEGSHGGLLETIFQLAGKLLGAQGEETAKLAAALTRLGLTPQQLETFVVKAFELIKAHLSPELVQLVLSRLPGLAKVGSPGSE